MEGLAVTLGVPARGTVRTADVAILEIEPEGHRLQYLNHLVTAAGPGRALVVTSERARVAAEYTAHLSGSPATHTVPDASRRMALENALDVAARAGVPRLVIPDGDLYVRPLLRVLAQRPRVGAQVRLLLMRTPVIGGPQPVRPATIVKPALVQLLRAYPHVRVFFLTDAFGTVTRRRGYPGVHPVRDPVTTSGAVPSARPGWLPPADAGTTTAGVFGVIGERKNLPVILDAMDAVPSLRLVVGGRVDPAVRRLLDSDRVRAWVASGRVVLRDQLLGSDEFGAALSSVDLALTLHDNDAPSGVVAEACLRGTPVVVPRGGWLDRVARDTGAGVGADLDGPSVAAAVRELARDRERYVAAARHSAAALGTTDFTDTLLGHLR